MVLLIAFLAVDMLSGGSIPQAHATAGLDGHAEAQPGNCNSTCTVTPLTTTSANDVIYLAFGSATAPTTNPPTVTDGASLTWTPRANVQIAGAYLFTWYAIAASPLSSDLITVTANDAGGAASLFAFGISGANTATPFDPHGGIPAADGTVATTPYNLAITTTNANDFIIGVVDGSSATSYTANAPNTQIDMYSTVPYAAVEYDIVSSAGTQTVSWAGANAGTAMIADAVQLLGASTTSVICVPSSVAMGSHSTCTATVTGSSPTGTVTWSQSGSGSVTFSASTCGLSSGACSVTATGLSAGSVTVQGAYGGDSGNGASSGTFSLAVTTPTLTVTPSQGPTGATTTLSGGSYSPFYIYNYCYKANTGSPSVCSSASQFLTDGSGNIPSGVSLTTSGASNGLVVVSDPAGAGTVIAFATFTITTPAISLVPTSSAAGSSVIVTGSGFSVSTAIGTFTFAGSTPGTQTCTSQITSATGAFACTFTVPSDVPGPYTVTAAGSDVGSVSADTASGTFTIPALPASTTTVVCSPSSVALGSPSTCTATVTGSSPTGTITWSQTSTNGGSVTFSASTCALSSGSCFVTATGLSAGSVLVLGAYGGDGSNAPSSGTFSLAVTTPTLTITPTRGPTGATTSLSGGSYSQSYTYNYCYEASTLTPSGCSSAHQLTTDSSGNIPGGKSLTTSGVSNGLVVVSDPTSSSVIALATFTITTPAISLVLTHGAVGSSVLVTGSGFSVSTAIGTFTFAGSTPATQTCTSQITSSAGAFSCTFTVPSSSVGAHTVTASGSDVGSVSADTASSTFTVDALPATTTSVVCSPSSVAVGSHSTCTATATGSFPTGTITWSQASLNGGSVTFSSSACALSSGSCSVTATGVSAGSVIVDGVYGGDGSNAASSGTFSLAVTNPASVPEFPVALAMPILFLLAAAIYLLAKSKVLLPKEKVGRVG